MQIEKITSTPMALISANNNKKENQTETIRVINNLTEYKPVSYPIISFGARLFRTPENFYEQPFNMDGMPDTMKKYLMEDFADRRHMPPSQMMALVFDDLNVAKNVEQAKLLYPDEPLFKNLKNPTGKARTNIVAGLQMLNEETKSQPLFKNGDNDLGIYILKKIYIEGKTLNEINKDFKADANSIYVELLPEIDYATLKKYGIDFPKQGFWHSFYSNRENFPYTYTPRKGIGSRQGGNSGEHIVKNPAEKTVTPQKRKYNISAGEKERITDSIINSAGNQKTTRHALKKSNINKENCNFLFKYMSPIMSVSADRINLSERLEEFYRTKGYGEISGVDFSNLSLKQGDTLREFWRLNPALREHFSNAIKDTIELFTEEYGENGENQRFKELLNFAENIKPEREKLKAEHLEKQKYYEEIFKPITDEEARLKSMNDTLDEELKETERKLNELNDMLQNPQKYWDKVRPKTWSELIDVCIDFKFVPSSFTSRYKSFFTKSDYIKRGDAYMNINPDITTNNDVKALIREINDASKLKFLKYDMAAKLAMLPYYSEHIDDVKEFLYSDVMHLDDILKRSLGDKVPTDKLMESLNNTYRIIIEPGKSSKKEMQEAVDKFSKIMAHFGFKDDARALTFDNEKIKQITKKIRDDITYSGIFKEYENIIKIAIDSRTNPTIVKFICDGMLGVLGMIK